MSIGPYYTPGRRIKNSRGFKVKAFDVLHNETCWFSKTYSSLRNIKSAIAHEGFNDRAFSVSDGWNADTLGVDYRVCVELYIYDVETWKLTAVRNGDGGTDIITLDECSQTYWSSRAGEWEDKVKTQEEQK